jgi:hypothetical protein
MEVVDIFHKLLYCYSCDVLNLFASASHFAQVIQIAVKNYYIKKEVIW